MTERQTLELPPDYAMWQERLEAEFFANRCGQPVVMFVDRDELQTLVDPGQDGARSLACAVRTLVDVSRGRSMFALVVDAECSWQAGVRSAAPPTLPLLALSVLAASEMRSDEAAPAHAYYLRLADALLPDGTQAERKAIQTEFQTGSAFAAVAAMWKQLDKWLDEQGGERGISTIPDNPGHFSRIGYPLSQSLLRRTDRAALTRFFDRMRLTRDGVPGPDSLVNRLRIWVSRRPQGFGHAFLRAVADPVLSGFLKPMIHGLATSWDGTVITADGLRRIEVELTIDVNRRQSWWVVPSIKNLSEDCLTGAVGDQSFEVVITRGPGLYYDAEGLPEITAEILRSGFIARGSASVAEFHPSDLLVFIESSDAGGWVSVDAVQAYETYIFAARPDLAGDVEAALQLSADSGWGRLPTQIGRQILDGYTIYRGVSFSDRGRLGEALSILEVKVASSVQFGEAIRARLTDGLAVLPSVARHIYLAGGEPDLQLPTGEGSRKVLVDVDGQIQEFVASIFPIPLSVIRHDLGEHLVETEDGDLLPFRVVDGIGRDSTPPGVGSLRWADGALGKTPAGAICGAETGAELTFDLALVRRGAQEQWLVDRAGHATELNEPPAPAFLTGAVFGWFDLPRDRGVWLLQKFRTGWELTLLRAEEPQFGPLAPSDDALWQTLATTRIDGQDALWRRYVDEWKRACGH